VLTYGGIKKNPEVPARARWQRTKRLEKLSKSKNGVSSVTAS